MNGFLKDNLVKDINHFEFINDIYARYLLYCEYHEKIPVSRVKFGHDMKKHKVGIKDSKKGKKIRYGVRLLPCKY